MARIDYDGLTNAAPSAVAQAAMQVIDQLQNHRSHVQAAAAAAVFLVLCDHFRVSPQDVMTATKNLLFDDREGKRPEFAALRDYVRYEIRR